MMEELIGKLKSEMGGKLSQEQIPEEKKEGIFSIIGDVVKREAAGQMMGGNLSHVMNLFSDRQNTQQADQIQSKMHSGIVSELTSKLGLSNEKSSGIASAALPAVIRLITHKNNATPENDPSPLHELFGGGIGQGAKNLLGGVFK